MTDASLSRISITAVSMESVPPDGMASRALMARLSTICSIWPGSARTMGRARGESDQEFDLLADRATQYLLHPRDGAVETQWSGLNYLSPGKREKLVGQQTGTLGGDLDLFHVLERLFPLRSASTLLWRRSVPRQRTMRSSELRPGGC